METPGQQGAQALIQVSIGLVALCAWASAFLYPKDSCQFPVRYPHRPFFTGFSVSQLSSRTRPCDASVLESTHPGYGNSM